MPLTDIKIRSAKPREKSYKLSDSGGLYLEVSATGGKYWRWKYRFSGKKKRLAFGVYPNVTLKMAREKRDSARQRVKGAKPGDYSTSVRPGSERPRRDAPRGRPPCCCRVSHAPSMDRCACRALTRMHGRVTWLPTGRAPRERRDRSCVRGWPLRAGPLDSVVPWRASCRHTPAGTPE